MRAITAATLRDRYIGLVGVDALTSDEESAYLASLNDRVRGAWYRFDWPDLIEIVQVPLQQDTTTNEWVSDSEFKESVPDANVDTQLMESDGVIQRLLGRIGNLVPKPISTTRKGRV